MIEVVPVPHVDAAWRELKDGMEIACKNGGYQDTADSFWTLCRKGEAFLIVDIEGEKIRGGAVCQPQTWAVGPVLAVLALCGKDLSEWITPLLKFFAGQFEVKKIVFEGRPGLKSAIPGARVVRHVYEVSL